MKRNCIYDNNSCIFNKKLFLIHVFLIRNYFFIFMLMIYLITKKTKNKISKRFKIKILKKKSKNEKILSPS